MKSWEDLLSSLEPEIGQETVSQWLRSMKIIRFDAANLYLEATPFQQTWFEEQILPRVRSRFCNNNQRPIKIHFESPLSETNDPLNHKTKPKKLPIDPNSNLNGKTSDKVQIEPSPLDPEFSLDRFIASSANSIPIEMAKEIAQTGKTVFNPVFFFGPSGCGKTHLLMAIAQKLQQSGQKVFYVNAQTFTEHFVRAIRFGHMDQFRNAYRDIDILLMDDIHILARRSASQEEFFHTFNTLHTLEKQIILSAQTSPSQLQDIEPRLISRFEWGIAVNIERPDPSTLHQILVQKAEYLGLPASSELIDFLLKRFQSKPTAPIDALHTLAIRSQDFNQANAEKILTDLLEKESNITISTEMILKETAACFGIRVEDITGKSQTREFAKPRQIAMYLCRNVLNMPFQTIGRIFDRDHSTVMSSVKQVQEAIDKKEPALKTPADSIIAKLTHAIR